MAQCGSSNPSRRIDALRVAVTRPDGTERVKLVSIDHGRREVLETAVNSAVEQARECGLSSTDARDALIALLAEYVSSTEPALELKQADSPTTITTEDISDDG